MSEALTSSAAARMARAHLEQLHALSSALAAAATAREVAQAATRVLADALRASTVAVGCVVPTNPTHMALLANVGWDDATLAPWTEFPLDTPVPLTDALHTGQPVRVAGPHEFATRYPHLLSVVGPVQTHAWLSVPLQVAGGAERHAVGALVATFATEFPDAESEWLLHEMARQIAQALERARLYEAEARARRLAEALQRVTTSLSSAQSATDVAEVVTTHVLASVGASGAAIGEIDTHAGVLRFHAFVGFPAHLAQYRVLPLSLHTPATDAVRERRVIHLSSLEEFTPVYPEWESLFAEIGYGAGVALPCLLDGVPVGVLSLGFPGVRRLERDELALLEAMAAQCALAWHRVRLLDEARLARRRSERLLALGSAWSPEMTLEELASEAARLSRDALSANSVAIYLRNVAGRHLDCLAASGIPHEVEERFRVIPLDAAVPVCDVVRSDTPLELSSPEEMRATYPPLAPLWEDMHTRSVTVLPLRDGSGAVGALSFAFAEARRMLPAERQFAREVAHHVALAIERVRLVNAERIARAHAEALGLERQRDADELELLYETSAIGMALIDEQLRFVRVNRVLASINGASVEAHLGRTLFEVLPEYADYMAPLYHRVFDYGEPVRDLEFRRPDLAGDPAQGERVWLATLLPVFDHHGTVRHVHFLAHEITARVRIEQQLRDSEQALQEAHRRKDEFLAMLSHELRNPLAPIRHALELVADGDASPERISWACTVVGRQVNQLTRLIDDLLDTSRIMQDRLYLQRTPMDLQRALELALETTQPVLRDHGHTVHMETGTTPMPVHGDLVRLAQAFSNLLNNAARYTPHGGTIRVVAELEEAQVHVRVIDNGMGIRASRLAQIFDMFERGDAPSPHGGGLGLGLTLVRRLVELHDGRVEARSDGPGRGSMFVVTLPLHHAMPVHAPQERASSPAAAAAQRVLVVDDNVDAAESLALLLERYGHQVKQAGTGAEAISVALHFEPHLILLDVGLPDMSGTEVCQRLRAHDVTRHARIVAVTGWGQAADRERTTAARFDAHFVKPVAFDRIAEMLHQV